MNTNKSKRLNYTVWIEKYRPTTVGETLLPSSVRKYFDKLIKEKDIPSMLFYSNSPGVGKTTVAKALCDEIEADYIYINISKDNGIDTLRSTIDRFASSISMSGGKKVAILDEFDGATLALQKALRASIEEFHEVCRFILTCNYHTQIISPIKSRCQEVDFNFMTKEAQAEMKPKIANRLCGILKFEKIDFDQEVVKELVDDLYPDIRKMLGLLQQYSKQTGLIDKGIFDYETVDEELYTLILNKKLTAARKFILEKSYDYDELYRAMFDNLVPRLEKDKQAQAILLIAEYMHRSAFAIDKEINFTACMLEIIGIL
jgi:replication factor C small subunit